MIGIWALFDCEFEFDEYSQFLVYSRFPSLLTVSFRTESRNLAYRLQRKVAISNYIAKTLQIFYGRIDTVPVPDRRSRILEVVIVRRLVTWVLGIWRGEGLGRVEKGEVSLQAT